MCACWTRCTELLSIQNWQFNLNRRIVQPFMHSITPHACYLMTRWLAGVIEESDCVAQAADSLERGVAMFVVMIELLNVHCCCHSQQALLMVVSSDWVLQP